METAGIQDFTIRDLFEPQFPRTKRFLSAIINFAKFREDKLTRFNELAGPTSELVEKRDLAEAECKAAEDELATIKYHFFSQANIENHFLFFSLFCLSFPKPNTLLHVQRATIAEEEPHVKALQQDITTKEKTIFELNKKQALLQEEIHDIKQQTASIVTKGVLSSCLRIQHNHPIITQYHTSNRQSNVEF
jgi:hypothetical protein